MTYGPEELSHDLTQVREDAASFETRARLEHFLLTLLRKHGTEAVAALLQSLSEHEFKRDSDGVSASEARYVSVGSGPQRIVIAAYLGPHSASVNVIVEDESDRPPEPNPRHQAFYEMWESLLGVPDSAVASLDPKRKAVFLVGLLEAEVMNGGLGQYLANTEGAHLIDTVLCLARIGAERTRAILIEAGKLRADAESYLMAWESKSKDFERLDEKFLDTGEDLAGLTADAFFDVDAGGGSV